MFFGKIYTADKNFTRPPVATNSKAGWAARGQKIKDIPGILKEILALVFFFVCLTVGGPMVGVCGTNTFAGRAVPSVHRQQDSHVGLHRKHRKSKRNTKKIIQQKIHYSILVLDAELKKGWGMRNCGTGMYIE